MNTLKHLNPEISRVQSGQVRTVTPSARTIQP